MVKALFSLSRSGMQDWLLQRLSAAILLGYALTLAVKLVCAAERNYSFWYSLMHQKWMQFFTQFALIALIVHAWIGIWTVVTDYIKNTALRLMAHIVATSSLLIYAIWGWRLIWKS